MPARKAQAVSVDLELAGHSPAAISQFIEPLDVAGFNPRVAIGLEQSFRRFPVITIGQPFVDLQK